MTVKKTIAEVLQEREQYPFGKPRPYTPDHPNLLAEGLPKPQIENLPLFSGFPKVCLVFLAIVAAAYGTHGLMTDDLYLPAKRSPGTHYHGVAALLIFGMIISFSGCLITVAVSEVDAVRRQITNKVLLTCLFISVIVFMLAGIAMDAAARLP